MKFKYLLVFKQNNFVKSMSNALIALVCNFSCVLLPISKQPQCKALVFHTFYQSCCVIIFEYDLVKSFVLGKKFVG